MAGVVDVKSAREYLAAKLSVSNRDDLDLLDRYDRWADDLIAGLAQVYSLESSLQPLLEVMILNHKKRDQRLMERDRQRVLQPDWFQCPETVGYVCYTDLFAKNLVGLSDRIPYLKNLGITYLHLMPILQPRAGANDGGYAVADYRALRPDLGTMEQLRETAFALHDAGISLTLDLVLNHVAMEHEWAIKAKAGDPKYREYFYSYPDRQVPDQYERTLPEVFPDFAPGNFTWDDQLQAWVWTTFNSYQWDVNWSNPDVFCEFADIIGNLANHGVDCLRLDAIAFIWKRLGTNCQSRPEVHSITQALRAFCRILAPSLIFKAEAIVGPAEVGAYLGAGEHAGKVSDLAYHNSLMVQIWSALAAQDASLLALALSRFEGLPSTTAWGTYLRCHDDIGWAIDDSDAAALGFSGHGHRMFLADYYTGKFPGSEARGVDFQLDANSGERRTSGSAASLSGVEMALESGDPVKLQRAIDKLICGYAVIFGFGGIPLLYMGDEIGLFNDHSFTQDPEKSADNRWIHRPAMDWPTAELASTGQLGHSIAGQIFERVQGLISARKRLNSFHASLGTRVMATSSPGVAVFDRNHPAGRLIQVYNFSADSRWLPVNEIPGLFGRVLDELTGVEFDLAEGLSLTGYEVRWLRKA